MALTVDATAAPPAKPVFAQFNTTSVVTLDPANAYLLYRMTKKADYRFLREVTPGQRADWQAARAAALIKANDKYQRVLASYVSAKANYDRQSAETRKALAPPEAPHEPTEENFTLPPAELDNIVAVAGGRVVRKDAPNFAYLIEVPPGTYRLYGQIALTGNGQAGVCMCMGTVKFDAAPGVITDLGVINITPTPIPGADGPAPLPFVGSPDRESPLTSEQVVVSDPGDFVPPVAANIRRVPARYRAAGKMPNYFGVLIDRMSPLQGVLAYRRDAVIDVRIGEALPMASGPIR